MCYNCSKRVEGEIIKDGVRMNVEREKKEYRDMHNKLGCSGCKFEDGEMRFKGTCCTRLGGPKPDETGRCMAARYTSKMTDGSKVR